MNNPNPTAQEIIADYIEDINKMVEVYDLEIDNAFATFEKPNPRDWAKERVKIAVQKKNTALEILEMIEKGALFLK